MRRELIPLLLALTYTAQPDICRPAEGPTIAGPIGGTDIRSAQLPPPGIYGGFVVLGSPAYDFVDGSGKSIPALEEAQLTKYLAAPFFVYVPPLRVLGGSIGLAGIFPAGTICGRLFASEASKCNSGIGDPYVELAWSRSFGDLRPPNVTGALPIQEGLSVGLGIGAVLPVGQFDSASPADQARSLGTNTLDIAPSVALTYTTPPFIADGTELSTKIYWNKYFENNETDFSAGSILSVDFALTERMGRIQAGLAGIYLNQLEDDRRSGIAVLPEGNRAEVLSLGGVIAFDLPEYRAGLKLKFQRTAFVENSVRFWGVTFAVIRRF